MGLTHITYNPLENGFEKDDCAATEPITLWVASPVTPVSSLTPRI